MFNGGSLKIICMWIIQFRMVMNIVMKLHPIYSGDEGNPAGPA